MNEASVIVTGATGMIGGLIVRRALSHSAVASVTTLGRRPTGLFHPKLRDVEHGDFDDLGPVEDRLAGHDVAFFCLGAYTGTVPDSEFRRITVDYAIEFARSVLSHSPEVAFCLLSGQGADRTEKSRISFARYKGTAENAILALGFSRTHIFRPGYIYPVNPRAEPNTPYRIMRALYPAVRWVYPNVGIPSEDLASVMLDVGLRGTPDPASPVLENRDIRTLALCGTDRSGNPTW